MSKSIYFYLCLKLIISKFEMSEINTSNHRQLSGAAMPVGDNKATSVQKLVALLVIVGFAYMGGFFVKVLSKG
jgi:hypothetical protein